MAASALGDGPSGFSLKPIRTAPSAKPPSGKVGTELMASAALAAGAGAARHPGRRARCHIRGGRQPSPRPPRWPQRLAGRRGGSGRGRTGSTRSRGDGGGGRTGCGAWRPPEMGVCRRVRVPIAGCHPEGQWLRSVAPPRAVPKGRRPSQPRRSARTAWNADLRPVLPVGAGTRCAKRSETTELPRVLSHGISDPHAAEVHAERGAVPNVLGSFPTARPLPTGGRRSLSCASPCRWTGAALSCLRRHLVWAAVSQARKKLMAANFVRCPRDRGESVKGGTPPFTRK